MNGSTLPDATAAPGTGEQRDTDPLRFLAGAGEMATLIRAYPWAATELGPPETWPQSLRTLMRMALTTRHPIFIFWGPRGICLYNDGYRETLGADRHPRILGMPAYDAWTEIWDVIGPQIEMVMRGDGATWYENQRLPMIRNGVLQDIYWTYSYCPIDEPNSPTGVGGVLVVCTETTEQVETRLELEASETRFRAALAIASLGTFEWQIQSGEVQLDARSREIFGFDLNRPLVLDDVLPRIAASDVARVLGAAQQSAVDQTHLEIEFPLILPDGTERIVAVRSEVKTDGDGNVGSLFGVIADITEQRRLEHERQNLLDMLAHDLKTPLSAFFLQTQSLQRSIKRRGLPDVESLNTRLAGFLDLANRMTELIAELDMQTKLVTGTTIPIQRQATDLIALLATAIQDIQQSGEMHTITIHTTDSTLIGEWDTRLLYRVVANLLGNAVKYSPGGGNIDISVGRDGDDAVLEIRDQGIGIPAGETEHIFAFRARGSNASSISGTGVGLAGVKRIVEQHGGTVGVASVEGEGSTFTVRLPLTPVTHL